MYCFLCQKDHTGDDTKHYTLIEGETFVGNDNVNIGDLESTDKGSGARKNGGKTMFDLVPLHLLAGVARVLTGGKMKYKEWNWAKGMIWSACFNCAMRHLLKFWYAREELDQESMEHHLDHAMCNLLFLKHYLTYYPDGDDRPPEGLFTTEDIDQLFDADEYCKRNNVGPYKD